MFVACDGPNSLRPGESEKVAATREVIECEINWPCQIERLYSDVNQGCRLGVSRAITWFFEQVEEGIILEDDCVPHPDFLRYCAELLDRYRHDSRVWCISATNLQNGHRRGDGSYYFSRYNHCWGWASWRRCWQHYDADVAKWPALRDSGLLETIFDDPFERKYWSSIWQRLVDEGMPDTWDYQWTFTCFANGGLTALPNFSLISNIGFDFDATHTAGCLSLPSIRQNERLAELVHPAFIVRDTWADRFTFDHHHGGNSLRRAARPVPRAINKIWRYLRFAWAFFRDFHK